MKNKTKYYNLKQILSRNCQYNLIIGERSNGKTYACLKYGLERYLKAGEQLAIVRRWQDDFKAKRGASMFDALLSNDEVNKLSNGEWTSIYYYGSRWYLCRYEDKKRITDDKPFAYGFAISSMEHDKSTSYPDICNILFDEFITRSYYLPDEFILFMNVLSTIVRDRNNIKIFMCGNTVSKNCPYFSEMGLTHIKEMKPGAIDVYTYGESNLQVAVEFCSTNKEGKASDLYFSFDNPRLNMITGKGNIWEIAIYPHLPVKYIPAEILFTYFIQFDSDLMQCEIVQHDDLLFTYIHRKTTPLKDSDNDLIYSPDYDPRPNWKRRLTKPVSDVEKKIYRFFVTDKVYYQDNETGEVIRNYLMWSDRTAE